MRIKIHVVALLGLVLAGCGGSGSNVPPQLPLPPPAPVNMAPTITMIADQDTSANVASAAISFTVADEDVAGALAINGTDGSITVSPVIDELGDAFITVVVTDGLGLSANTSFLLSIVGQQLSFQQFVRTEFVQVEDGQPALINAVIFDQDAADDDFADLLAL